MKLFDFSKRFSRVAEAWIKQNAGKHKLEVLEAKVPDLYIKWLNTPAAWLDGATPSEYFNQYSDPAQLCDMLKGYCMANIAVPDPLLDRIAALGGSMTEGLMALFTDKSVGDKPRALAGALLVEIGGAEPLQVCVDMLLDEEESVEVREQAVNILRGMGKAAESALLAAMETAQGEAFSAVLDVLLDCSCDPRLYDWAVYGLRNQPGRREVYAAYLLRLGDERAIAPMTQMLSLSDIGYLEYMELSNAIESLGGEVRIVREFSGDAVYEQMRMLKADEDDGEEMDKPKEEDGDTDR